MKFYSCYPQSGQTKITLVVVTNKDAIWLHWISHCYYLIRLHAQSYSVTVQGNRLYDGGMERGRESERERDYEEVKKTDIKKE